ncbi:MAG: hypothetical protein VXZ39_10575 [Planctomycetota bacterium]|nr:hypothetical protein [Planctomycetota bacterium]
MARAALVNKGPVMIRRRRADPGFVPAMLGARAANRQHGAVMRFLKENWLWIVVPLVLFVAAVAAIVLSTGGAGEQPYSFR